MLVTGADGFIGRRMMAAVRARGWRAIGLDRTAPSAEITKVQEAKSQSSEFETRNRKLETPRGEAAWITADIAADARIELPAGIDAIIHLAGKAHALAEVAQDEAEYFRINTDGTRRMLEAAQRAGVRAFVLFSTVKAVGEAPTEVTSDKGQGTREAERNDQGLMPNDHGRSGETAAAKTPQGRPACSHALPGEPRPETRKAAGACEHADLRGTDSDISAHQCASVVNPHPKLETRNAKPGTALQGDQQSLASTDVEAGEASGVPLRRSSGYAADGTPLDEFCSSPPDTPYGQSKRAAEALVLEGGYVPHPVVLRPCLVYGPTPKGNLEKMIAAVRRGRFPPLPEVGNKRSMVHVDDVIAAALLAAEHPAAAGQIFVVADNEPFSTRQLFEWICTAAGRRVPRWTMPLWALQLLGRVGDGIGRLRGRRFVFDSDALAKLTGNAWYSSAKLQRELGWRPRHSLRETVVEMVRR